MESIGPTDRRRSSLLDDNPTAAHLTGAVHAICTESHVNYTITPIIRDNWQLNKTLVAKRYI